MKTEFTSEGSRLRTKRDSAPRKRFEVVDQAWPDDPFFVVIISGWSSALMSCLVDGIDSSMRSRRSAYRGEREDPPGKQAAAVRGRVVGLLVSWWTHRIALQARAAGHSRCGRTVRSRSKVSRSLPGDSAGSGALPTTAPTATFRQWPHLGTEAMEATSICHGNISGICCGTPFIAEMTARATINLPSIRDS